MLTLKAIGQTNLFLHSTCVNVSALSEAITPSQTQQAIIILQQTYSCTCRNIWIGVKYWQVPYIFYYPLLCTHVDEHSQKVKTPVTCYSELWESKHILWVWKSISSSLGFCNQKLLKKVIVPMINGFSPKVCFIYKEQNIHVRERICACSVCVWITWFSLMYGWGGNEGNLNTSFILYHNLVR